MRKSKTKPIISILLLVLLSPFLTIPEEATPASKKLAALDLQGFSLIPAGTFEMGDHQAYVDPKHGDDETPIHAVSLDAFQMGIYAVRAKQYAEFLNSCLLRRRVEVRKAGVYLAGGDDLLLETREASAHSRIGWNGKVFSVLDNRADHPVVCIRWEGAAAYCNWLSEQGGLPAVYETKTWACDFSKRGLAAHRSGMGIRGARQAPRSLPRLPLGRRGRRREGELARIEEPLPLRPRALDDAGRLLRRDDAPPRRLRPDGKAYHGMRGDSWYNGENGHGRVANRNPSYYRGPQDPNQPYYHVGFRVVLAAAAKAAGAGAGAGATAGVRETPQTLDKDPRRPGAGQAGPRGAGPALLPENRTPTSPNQDQTLGLFTNGPGAFVGYTLLAPKHNTSTYLLDNEGRAVHKWASAYEPGQSAYLLPNGHLLRAGMLRVQGSTGGGEGGRIEEFDWDGKLVWEFEHATRDYQLHHDLKPLPNGHVLALMVERKTKAEAIAAGFDPRLLRDEYLAPDAVVEIEPIYPKGGRIVWQWKVWDHLVQDFDTTKTNYGEVAAHPELVDTDCNGRATPAFWNHMNSIDYSADLEQILLSVRGCNEIWILDHSTTTAQAAGHSGGKSGRGGDLLYRWGNPAA